MEQFNDTPTVNGVAYPTVTLQPKTYRLRFLNAANDRFFNFQWYVADPTTGTLSEVALNPTELAAAQTDPNVVPTPDTSVSLPGPDWIQIGTEGGFLPAPAVINGHQPTTWITDPTRFDWGNVDKHSLLIAPAERADVIVDFSKYAGKTLILYNDAPAAFPGRIANYDYYTGAPDLTGSGGAPTILPGYGPNTRTIMQVTIANAAPAPAFNLPKLQTAFSHKADGSGVFESSQDPIIVGQAKYNSAYGTSFAAGSNCNPVPNATNPGFQVCDGFVRVADTTTFGFNTLLGQSTKTILHLEPKAMHDETNASTFDPYGRMQANLGVEAQPATSAGQNVTLYPYINPITEIINGTLPAEGIGDLRRQRRPGERRRHHADLERRRRHPDLAHHAQRRGHAPDPLPPLQRPAPQPGHLGQHHHPAGRQRARLEGDRAAQPARGHHRRAAAGRSSGSVGGAELHPQPEPAGRDRLHRRASTTSPRTAPGRTPSPTSSSTTAGSTSGTATS